VGGSGKTPFSEYLLRRCLSQGFRVAYLSRGYGRETKGYLAVEPFATTALEAGDEAIQMANKLPEIPVAVCEDRVEGVRRLLESHSLDLVILDDAFQHRRLARDYDILMLDGRMPPWKQWMLPLGPLREPLSGMKRADLIVVNKVRNDRERRSAKSKLSKGRYVQSRSNPNICFSRYSALRLVPFSPSYELLPVDQIGKRGCYVFCGIAKPEQFVEDLEALGLLVIDRMDFGDHYHYGYRDMARIGHKFKKATARQVFIDSPIIVTTEKDYHRLRSTRWFEKEAAGLPFYYLEIQLEIVNGVEKIDELMEDLNRKIGPVADE
jgi:tetraacyldisaccharide 4'-kinase